MSAWRRDHDDRRHSANSVGGCSEGFGDAKLVGIGRDDDVLSGLAPRIISMNRELPGT